MMRRATGFTMVELVMTMIIVGILAAFAIPRFANRSGFDARGIADQTAAAIQYGRKVAVAARRNVCVTIDGTNKTVALTMATLAGSNQACSANVLNPATGTAYVTAAAPSGLTMTVAPATTPTIIFDGQGRPGAGASITVAASGDPATYTVNVVAGTGHVYGP